MATVYSRVGKSVALHAFLPQAPPFHLSWPERCLQLRRYGTCPSSKAHASGLSLKRYVSIYSNYCRWNTVCSNFLYSPAWNSGGLCYHTRIHEPAPMCHTESCSVQAIEFFKYWFKITAKSPSLSAVNSIQNNRIQQKCTRVLAVEIKQAHFACILFFLLVLLYISFKLSAAIQLGATHLVLLAKITWAKATKVLRQLAGVSN